MKVNYFKKIEELLILLPHKIKVQFAIYCAESVTDCLDDKTRGPALAAIAAAKTWLKEPTQKNNAANAAATAANAAYTAAAYTAANAAANAATAAANAAYTAANAAATAAAYTAANAANAAAYTAAYTKKDIHKVQYTYLISICNFSKIEKLIYGIKD